jgi:hypothetical protein
MLYVRHAILTAGTVKQEDLLTTVIVHYVEEVIYTALISMEVIRSVPTTVQLDLHRVLLRAVPLLVLVFSYILAYLTPLKVHGRIVESLQQQLPFDQAKSEDSISVDLILTLPSMISISI